MEQSYRASSSLPNWMPYFQTWAKLVLSIILGKLDAEVQPDIKDGQGISIKAI